jgi:hypothetical protein
MQKATNEEYVANYNNLQSMVQAEVLNLVRANIENSPEGKTLLDNQLKLVKYASYANAWSRWK